jgi:collagen type VI alpha
VKAHGDRDRVANILIVITDGQSQDKAATLAAAQALHGTNVNVFAIGVGNSLDHQELNAIASKPANVFTVDNFDALTNIEGSLKRTACAGQYTLPSNAFVLSHSLVTRRERENDVGM